MIPAGLNEQEVNKRIQDGLKNSEPTSITKTNAQIIKDHVFTLFNLLNFLIALALAFVGAWTNLFFIAIIVANLLIGIYQEMHAKKLVDGLSLLISPTVHVMRNHTLQEITASDIVQDDIMVLESGQQILCDGEVIDGDIEVNESLLTGEVDPIHKRMGAEVLSGSSVISGRAYVKVVHVGNENYAAKIANEAKRMRSVHSELLSSLQSVTKITSIMILPLGILLFSEAFLWRQEMVMDAVVTSAAGLLGMLPKGLVLLISTSLAIGVSRLAKSRILIQELYSLETLAHVDVLCLDKTGTITDGCMKVETLVPFVEEMDEMHAYMGSFLAHADDNNATFQALHAYFKGKDTYTPDEKIAFSSVRKWSAMHFNGFGTLVVGAPERLYEGELPAPLQTAMEEGKRVLIIGVSQDMVKEDQPLPNIKPYAAVVIQDTIRKHAKETLAYFKDQGVRLKVISGDHPATVSAIAKKAGLDHYERYVDMSTIGTEDNLQEIVDRYTVFGRVTPLQKKQLVQALQQLGHSVAMTGDGVNDLLAMKEADCSIAVAQGSDAARQIAQVVLLDSDFSALPQVLLEGRRVVNHVTRVASVFFIKTLYSLALSLFCVLTNIPFPFIPIQITLLDAVIEAFPGFVTMLEPDHHRVQGSFLDKVMRKAIPNAVAIMAAILALYYLCPRFGIREADMITMMYLCVAGISMLAVLRSCLPFTPLRTFTCVTMVLGFLVAVTLFPSLLEIETLPTQFTFIAIVVSFLGFFLAGMLTNYLHRHQWKTNKL